MSLYLKNVLHQLHGVEINVLHLALNAPTEHSSTTINVNPIHHVEMDIFGIIVILNVCAQLAILAMVFHVFNAQMENLGIQKRVVSALKDLLILDHLVNL